jgi:hypothetical protein
MLRIRLIIPTGISNILSLNSSTRATNGIYHLWFLKPTKSRLGRESKSDPGELSSSIPFACSVHHVYPPASIGLHAHSLLDVLAHCHLPTLTRQFRDRSNFCSLGIRKFSSHKIANLHQSQNHVMIKPGVVNCGILRTSKACQERTDQASQRD